MKIFREKKDKKLWSDYVLMAILLAISAFLIFLIVETIKSIITKTVSDYSKNLITNYICIIAVVVVFFLMLLFENKGKLKYSEWLRSCILLYFLTVILVFNVLHLYSNNIWSIVACNLTGLLLAIIGVSIFYNYLKNSANQVKAKAIMVVLFSLVFTIAMGFVIELGQYLINLITKTSEITLKKVIFDILYTTASSLALNIVFYLSLKKSKKVINQCLIYIE